MGELHLEIIVDRMKREFKVEANVGKPQVAFRETITQAVVEEYKHIKQTGGHGQYGHVKLRLEPNAAGKGFVFVNEIVGGVIPREFIPAVEKGVRETLRARRHRRLSAHRRQGRRSSTAATTTSTRRRWRSSCAGSLCLREAARKARPILLEPMMTVEVVTPEDYMGAVMGDLNARRGRRSLVWTLNAGFRRSAAEVPLETMFGYSTELRSATQGRATYTMEFSTLRTRPAALTEKLFGQSPG